MSFQEAPTPNRLLGGNLTQPQRTPASKTNLTGLDRTLPRTQKMAVRSPAGLQAMEPSSNTIDSFTSGLSSQSSKPLIRSIKEELLKLSTRGSVLLDNKDTSSSNLLDSSRNA